MLAASGIAASVTHHLTSQACCSTSRCDGGRVKGQQQDMVALPPRRLKKQPQEEGNAGVAAAWSRLAAAVSGLLQVHAAAAEEEESILNGNAASVYERLTAGGSQSPEPPADSFNFELPELKLGLPQLDFKAPDVQAPDFQVPEVELSGIGSAFSGAAAFVADNLIAVVGVIAVVAIPLLVSQVLGRKPEPYGSVSAKDAYAKLSDDSLLGQQLLDIRPAEDINTEGTPDLRALRKRVIQVPYSSEQEDAATALVEKLKTKFKKPEETTLYILDRFDGNSLAVAKLATEQGFLGAYAVKGGAEGPNGWRLSELPWLAPRKGFKLDLSVLKDVFDSTFGKETGSAIPAAVGVAAAAAAGVVVFSEAETALQLVGSAALLQLFVKKVLFAKDRQETFKQVKELLDTKVAPAGLIDDIKSIGKTLASAAEQVTTPVLGEPAAAAASPNGVATYEAKAEDSAPAPAIFTEEPTKAEVQPEVPVTEAAGLVPGESSIAPVVAKPDPVPAGFRSGD